MEAQLLNEVQKLKEILNDHGIYECPDCRKYSGYLERCDCCHDRWCLNCYLSHGKLSNMNVFFCDECINANK